MHHTATNNPDHIIRERLLHQEQAALTTVYTDHQAAMFSTARAILRDSDRAFDVTQDVLTDLWTRPERFDPARGSLRTYLTTRARSRALDVLRSEQARARREQRARGDDRVVEEVAETVVSRSEAAALHARLAGLKETERTAIELAYFGDLSYRDVATHLSLPEGTVKSRIRSGLGRLRAEVAA